MAEKTCRKCSITQPIAEFYPHPQMRDGHLNMCKTCSKLATKRHYREHPEHYRAYERGRANLAHRVDAREAYRKSLDGTAVLSRGKKAYVTRNPQKRAAHVAVGNALRNGRLVRQPCEKCGAEKVHAHHDDYTKPLDVRWLCNTHHIEHHKQLREVA